MGQPQVTDVGDSTKYTEEQVRFQGRHKRRLGQQTDEPGLKGEDPDTPGYCRILLKEVREVFEGLITTAEDPELREEMLATDIKPVAADEGACCERVLVLTIEAGEDVVEQLRGEHANHVSTARAHWGESKYQEVSRWTGREVV